MFKDQVAIVTGAASGIGAATAYLLGKRGAIVVLVDRNQDGLKRTAAYIASKGAIVSLTKTSAVDFAKQGVRINAVAPAVIDTAMSRSSREGSKDPEAMQAWRLSRHPVGRVDEVAKAICYLAGDDASFITGTVLMVDGGWTAA